MSLRSLVARAAMLGLLPVATGAQTVPAPSYGAVRIETARLVERHDPAAAADLAADSPADSGASLTAVTSVSLPLRLRRSDGNAIGVFWFQLDLPARRSMPSQPAIFIPRFTDGGTFYLNGTPLLSIPAADALTRVRWRRARAFALPDALLGPDGNHLLVKVVSRDFTVDMPHLLLGREADLQQVVEARQWVDQYGSQFTGFTAVIVGSFILSIWWYRRRERYYLFFGLSSLLWAVRTLNYSIETMPADSWWWWRAGHFLVVAAATATLAGFFLSFAGLSTRRWVAPVALHAVAGPVAVVASDGRLHEFVYRYWQAPLFIIIIWALGRFAWWGHKTRSGEALLITIGVVVAILLAANDYLTVSGLLAPTRVYTLHLALPVLLITIGALLTIRFVRALRTAEAANLELAERLAEKERELAAHYGRMAEIERREASTAERQRIMQDMHDGLGAQLVSSLIVVERGTAQPSDVARLLRESIDEMRLAIDAFGQPETDLQGALANLRYRMEPRLRAAGIVLDWSIDEAFEQVSPDDASSLQVLRIVQEAMSNAIRHSRATRLSVRFDVDRGGAHLSITDDGVGLPLAGDRQGRGLDGIRRRAHALGGDAQIDSTSNGTTVSVRFPAHLPAHLPAHFPAR